MKKAKRRIRKIIAVTASMAIFTGVLAGCSNSDGAEGDESPVLKVVIPAIGTHTEDTDRVEEEINKILVENGKAQIDITWSDFGNLSQQLNMMLTNESELDIGYVYGSGRTYANNGQLLDMAEYIEEDGQEIVDLIGEEYIDAVRMDGSIYYLPNKVDHSQEIAFIANKSMMDEMGIAVDEEKIWSLDEIHDLIVQAMEMYPGIYGVVPHSSGSNLIGRLNFDSMGDTYNIGVVENRGSSQEVVSITECEDYIEFSRTMRQWYEEGLIMPDILSNSEAGSTYIIANQAFGNFVSGSCPNGTESDDTYRYLLTVESQWASSDCAERMGFVINAKTQYPEESFEVLKEMYLNEDIKELLCFGIEGEHYVLDDEGRAAYPEGVTADTATYNVGFQNWFVFPDGQCDIVPFTNVPDYWEKLNQYDEEAEISPLLGCIFDPTPVGDAYTACMNAYSQYYDAILCGAIDTDEGIAEYRAALEAAGEDQVIEEKQRQLDAFLAENQ